MHIQPGNAEKARASGGAAAVVVALGLLVLPVVAAYRRGAGVPWIAGYVLVMSAATYWVYRRDKQAAQEGTWRQPESMLHLMELAGGWPGALVAQRRLRHKCSKLSYQVVFWTIVLAYQLVAFDSMQEWRLARGGLQWAEGIAGSGVAGR